MSHTNSEQLLEKIQKRSAGSLAVEEVFWGTKKSLEVISYLKCQKYLDCRYIEILIRNNYSPEHPFGYILRNKKNDIVGFLGAVFSCIPHGDEVQVYCNLHTWIVEKNYRRYASLLLNQLLEKEITLTCYTPIKTLVGLFEKCGFNVKKLKYKVVFLTSVPNWFQRTGYRVKKCDDINCKRLGFKDLGIYNDHVNLPCEKFILTGQYPDQSENYIFIIATKVKKHKKIILNILYVSDKDQLKKNWNKVKYKIAKYFKVNFIGEFFYHEGDSIIPKKTFLSKSVEKTTCIRGDFTGNEFGFLYSDLLL
jgi:hypothetical protein